MHPKFQQADEMGREAIEVHRLMRPVLIGVFYERCMSSC